MYCQYCGKEVHEGELFCQYCGRPLTVPLKSSPVQESQTSQNVSVPSHKKSRTSHIIRNIVIGIGIFFICLIGLSLAAYFLTLPHTSTNNSSPMITPSPSSSGTIPIPNITIYYDILHNGGGILEVNMTIMNNGYSGFDTSPAYFSVDVNNVQYNVDLLASLGWNDVNILNNGTYSGVLFFDVPTVASSVSFSYSALTNTLQSYNIIWKNVT